MSRSKTPAKSGKRTTRERLEAVPWALLLQVAVVIGRRWRALSEKDRARLARLVRESQGRPDRLGSRERLELRKLAGKLEVKRMFRELLPLLRGGAKPRKRRRGARA